MLTEEYIKKLRAYSPIVDYWLRVQSELDLSWEDTLEGMVIDLDKRLREQERH